MEISFPPLEVSGEHPEPPAISNPAAISQRPQTKNGRFIESFLSSPPAVPKPTVAGVLGGTGRRRVSADLGSLLGKPQLVLHVQVWLDGETRTRCYATRAVVRARRWLSSQRMPKSPRAAACESASTGSETTAVRREADDSDSVRPVAETRRGPARAMVTKGRPRRWATFAKSSAVPNSRGCAASRRAAADEGSISAATRRCSSTRTAKK